MDPQPTNLPTNPVPPPAVTPVAAPAASPPVSQPLPSVPETWPGAFGIYKYSRDVVRLNIVPILVFSLFNLIVGGSLEWKLGRSGGVISFLLGNIAEVCLILLYFAGVRRQHLSLGETLNKSLPLLLKMIGLSILVGLSLVVSFLLLIIPFLIVLPRLTLAPYFLVDKNMGILEAYKTSWSASKGYSTKVWGIIGVSILMAMIMLTLIGIPVAIYLLIMYGASMAVLYEFINKQHPVTATAPADNAVNPAAPPPASIAEPPAQTTIEPTPPMPPPPPGTNA